MTTTALHICKHCGTPFHSGSEDVEFCCAGCQFVSHLLNKHGLEEFYHYGRTQAPIGNFVFHERNYSWLREVQDKADTREALFGVQGISCAGCIWLLETLFLKHPGAVSCRVNSSNGTLRLQWQPRECDLVAYARDVQRFGYILGPADGEMCEVTRPLVRKLGLCGALALNAMLFALPRYLGLDPGDRFSSLFESISFALATLSILIGGGYFFRRAMAALRVYALHIDLPISLGLLFAYLGSVVAWLTQNPNFAYFDFISIFTFLMLLGRWLQERSVEANQRRLLKLKLSPGDVRIFREDAYANAAAETLKKGDRYSIEKGKIVPMRSRLIGQNGLFALNWITGEPKPREYHRGNIVPAGARNLSTQEAIFEALEAWKDSHLAMLLQVESTQQWRNAAMQRLIGIYLSLVLFIGIIGFIGWSITTGDWFRAGQVLISILVVSCPCAIGVALPLLDDIANVCIQQKGIYIREGSIWARLRKVKNILFDKTGTITLETLSLANPEALAALDQDKKSTLLCLVKSSLHPIAACLRECLLAEGVEFSGEFDVREIIGLGLEWESSGIWRLGRASWAGGAEGTTFTYNGTPLASFQFREEIRPFAASQIEHLHASDRKVFLLSGDHPARVREMASKLHVPLNHAFGGLTPTEKANLIRTRWPKNSLMIGDGANDSLAFDAALCRGTPSIDSGLLEQKADFYILGTSLAGLSAMFSAAVRHRRITIAVFLFAIAYNFLAIAASLAGLMTPLIAAVIMPISSLISIAIVMFGFRFQALSSFKRL